MDVREEKDLAGCCGLFCGLCPRYQSKAPSRCLGCQLGPQHSYCSIYRCCSIKRGFLTCAECQEFPCKRLIRVLGVEEGLDSFVSHRPAIPNLEKIRTDGLESFLAEQKARRLHAEYLIQHHNDGRSMTLFCTAAALIPLSLMEEAVTELEADGHPQVDAKERARRARIRLETIASGANVDLRLRKKR